MSSNLLDLDRKKNLKIKEICITVVCKQRLSRSTLNADLTKPYLKEFKKP